MAVGFFYILNVLSFDDIGFMTGLEYVII